MNTIRAYFTKRFISKVLLVDCLIAIVFGILFMVAQGIASKVDPNYDTNFLAWLHVGNILIPFSMPLYAMLIPIGIFYWIMRHRDDGEYHRGVFGTIIIGVGGFVFLWIVGAILAFLIFLVMGFLGFSIH